MNFISLILGDDIIPHDGGFTYSGPAKHKEDFSTHYQSKIRPLTSLIEKSRIESLESYRKRGRIACITFAVTTRPLLPLHFQRALSEWLSADYARCWPWFEDSLISDNKHARIVHF